MPPGMDVLKPAGYLKMKALAEQIATLLAV